MPEVMCPSAWSNYGTAFLDTRQMALTREQRPQASEKEQVQDWAPMPFPST